jgi:hypothetical protein
VSSRGGRADLNLAPRELTTSRPRQFVRPRGHWLRLENGSFPCGFPRFTTRVGHSRSRAPGRLQPGRQRRDAPAPAIESTDRQPRQPPIARARGNKTISTVLSDLSLNHIRQSLLDDVQRLGQSGRQASAACLGRSPAPPPPPRGGSRGSPAPDHGTHALQGRETQGLGIWGLRGVGREDEGKRE